MFGILYFGSHCNLGWVELLAYGIFLNIIGAALLLIKGQLDKDMIEAAVDKRFQEAGKKQRL